MKLWLKNVVREIVVMKYSSGNSKANLNKLASFGQQVQKKKKKKGKTSFFLTLQCSDYQVILFDLRGLFQP